MRDKLDDHPEASPPRAEGALRVPPRVPDHELLRRIGRGSYGEVWLARSVVGTFRAVKVVYREEFADPHPYDREFAGLQRFEPLSRANEGFMDILQIGREDAAGYFYYVMELADDANAEGGVRSAESLQERLTESGEVGAGSKLDPESYVPKTLSKQLFQRGRLPLEECLDLGLTLNLALGHLHRAGLIHRDIKPSNIIFVGGVPKLADIGLVVPVAEARSFVGTEGFIPPEGPNSPQADLYSLGKVIYEASMGKDRQDFPEPFTKIAEAPDSDALLELNAVILKACAANVSDRYRSAEEMNAELALVKSGQSVRRKRTIERHLARLKRASVVGAAVTLVVAAALLWQTREARQMTNLAKQNLTLAQTSQLATEESRRHLAQMYVANGRRLMEQNDSYNALLWFAHALQQVQGDPVQEEVCRLRFESLFRQVPKLVHLFKHNDAVWYCEFSPDGRLLVSASRDGTAQVWDLSSGKPLTPPLQHSNSVNMASFSPDGRRVVTASFDGTAKVWDAVSGTLLVSFEQHTGSVSTAFFDRTGNRVVTASSDHTARIWSASTGEPLVPPLHHNAALRACFSPDGTSVATASNDRTARIWNSTNGLPLTPPLTHPYAATCLAFSPDGRRLATGEGWNPSGDSADHSIAQIWDVATGELLASRLQSDTATVGLAFSPDGRRLITYGGKHNTVRTWNGITGDALGPPIGLGQEICKAQLSPDGGRLGVSFADGEARVFDARTGTTLSPLLRHSGYVLWFAFSPDGRLVATASDDHTLKVWDLASAAQEDLSLEHPVSVSSACFSPDGHRILTACDDGNARLWNSSSGELLEPKLFHGRHLAGAQFSPDGTKILTGGHYFENGSPVEPEDDFATQVRLWDAKKGKAIAVPLQHKRAIHCASFSQDSQRVVTASADYTARVWNANTGSAISPPLEHRGDVFCAEFSPDGRYVVTASADRTAQVWNAVTGEKVCPPMTIMVRDDRIALAKFSPDGKKVLTIQGILQTAQIWDSTTGQPLTPTMKHGGTLYLGAWSPDGRRIVTGGLAPEAKVWDALTAQLALPPLIHGTKPLEAVSFSPDGRLLATSGEGTGPKIWSAATGELLSAASRSEGTVWNATFSPDSRRLVSVDYTRFARVWDLTECQLPTQDMISLAELLSGSRLENGNSVPLNAESLARIWQPFASKYPGLFRPTLDQVRLWYKQRLRASQEQQDLSAALFFVNQLIDLEQKTTSLAELREKIVAHRIPPRNPQAMTEVIDLSDYYNWSLAPLWYPEQQDQDLDELPVGIKEFARTKFDVRGIVGVAQNDQDLPGKQLPTSVSGIKIMRQCRQLHFLHASWGSSNLEGAKIGEYRVTYTNQQELVLPIVYGQELRDWYSLPDSPKEASRAEIAWNGYSTRSREEGHPLRLFKWDWNNPWPDVEIKSVSLVAGSAEAQPFLVALTAE